MRDMVFLSEATIYLMERLNIVPLLKLVILIKQLLQLIILNSRYLKQVKKRLLMQM